MSARQCPQCGAQVDLPEGRMSDVCAFCETPLVAAEGEREPVDLVAPFVLDKKQAAGRLETFLAGQMWAPEAVRKLGRADELGGVLIPFWVYDAACRSTYSARVGIHWYRTETYTVTVNGRHETRTRQVQETEWFPVQGSHVADYQGHLVSGSRGLPEAEANELEPFDLGRAIAFSPEAVAGSVAERPSIKHDEAVRTANQELATRENQAIRAFLAGDVSSDVQNHTDVTVEKVQLALLPVYVGTYKHQGKVIRLLVNGQTGEVVGTVPKSYTKIFIAVAIVVALGVAMVLCAGAIGTISGGLGGHR